MPTQHWLYYKTKWLGREYIKAMTCNRLNAFPICCTTSNVHVKFQVNVVIDNIVCLELPTLKMDSRQDVQDAKT